MSTVTASGAVPQFVTTDVDPVAPVAGVKLLLLVPLEELPRAKLSWCVVLALELSALAHNVTRTVPLSFELAGIWNLQSATSADELLPTWFLPTTTARPSGVPPL